MTTPNEYERLADRIREVEVKLSNEIYSLFENLGEVKDELEQKISADSRYLQLAKRIEEIARRVHDLERGESPHEELFEYVESVEHKVNGLSMRTADIVQRLNEQDAKNQEVIDHAVAYALESGNDDHP